MGEFSVEIDTSKRDDGEVTLAPDGELDLAAAPELEARLAEVESGAPELIVVDMAAVGFIDSSGLRVLLGAAARARDGGWRFRLTTPRGQVSKLLELTRSDTLLEIVP
jgi:anti-anti-sigma factor